MHVFNPFAAIVNLTAAAAELPTKIRKSAAHALSISVRALDYLIANKQLNTRKLGRKVMVPHADLVRFAKADHHHLTEDPNEVVN